MKRILTFALALLCVASLAAQRPVNRQVSRTNTTVQASLNRTGNATLNNGVKTYSYTVSEMSIANVSVMDYATTVKQEGCTDKVKVTISNCNVSISYYLYDANNSAITKNTLSSNGGTIDMSAYQPGEYRLQIIEQKGAEKNFKIVKKQK